MEKMKKYTLSEMEDRYIGKKGSAARDEYEYELKMELLGKIIGVNKSQNNYSK